MSARPADRAPKPNGKTILIAYVPVVHTGYLEWFARFPEVTELWLLGRELIPEYRALLKDLRAIEPTAMVSLLHSLQRFSNIQVATPADLTQLAASGYHVIAPDEDISRQVILQYFSPDQVTFDTVFLRWEAVRTTVAHELEPDVEVSEAEFDRQMMQAARDAAQHSSDWWRQVGAALVIGEELKLVVRNRHLPQDLQHYSDGDPRALFQSGEQIEFTSSIHAEAELIAQVAKQGLKIEGASVYCTTFPCPVCAKLLARAGIAKLYYSDGYSLLDGENVLKNAGVQVVKVVSTPK